MRFFKLTLLLLIFSLFVTGSSWADEWPHDQVEVQVLKFLRSLDVGSYEDVLESMSPLFKALNDSSQWTVRQKTLRDAYGAVINRSPRHLTHRRTYTNSPDSNYVIVQYESIFANKAKAVETVVLHCPDMQECLVREYVIN